MPLLGSESSAIAPFGLEVFFDLAGGLSPGDATALKDLFYRHKLLLFRDQHLTRDQQFAVLEAIGPVDRASPLDYVRPDDAILGSENLAYHSDMHFAPFPAEGVSLLALDVEEGQTFTAFVNAQAAYERLPAALRRRIEDMRVVRVATPGVDNAPPAFETPPGVHTMERDLVMVHPETGERIVYTARCSTSRVIGMDEPESTALLSELYGYIYDPAHELRHYWRNGDLIIWDNLALQHARPNIAGVRRRKLQRATIATHDQTAQIPEMYKAPTRKQEFPAATAQATAGTVTSSRSD